MDKTKPISRIIVFYSALVIARFNAQTDCSSKIDRLYIKDSAVSVKGQALQLNCIVSNFKDSSNIMLTRSDLQASEQITQCITSYCTNVPFKWRQSYTVSSDNSGVYLQIKSLNRSEDENTWICKNTCGESKSLQFTVHTVPQLLQFDNPSSQNQDLVRNTVTLKCSTGCAYPQPSFTWFYNETGDSRQEWSNSGSVSDKAGECTDSERIYTSTLSLPRYTTFPNNADKTVKFSCGITSFPGLTQSLYTGSSVNVRFAVRVTNVALKDGTSAPADPLNVVNGTSKTLTCITGVSRPAATVVWYIGTDEKQRSNSSSSFTFIPQNNDHNKQIYCKAFNIQPEKDAVSSNKATLYILVRVASVILKDGSTLPTEPIEVISGVSKTLTCTTSASRPNATIAWYIGADMEQLSYSSTFTFTSGDGDHKKQVFCKANNTKAENEAVSSNKFTLYVKVRVTSVTLKDGDAIPTSTLKVTSGISKTLICTASASRPTSTIIWYIGMDEKKRSTVSTSSLTFTPENSDHGNQVYCKAFNLQLENQAVSSNKPSLFVKEPTTVKLFYIGERNGQANFTAEEHDVIQFTCEVGRDPASNIKITFEGEILAEQADTNKLTFIRQDVDCLHSGVYFCEGNDSNGLTSSKNVTLIVKCSPRPRRQILRNITSPLYVPVTLTFKAIAYPEPGPKGFSWYKENKVGWIPLLSNEDLHLSSSGLQTSLTIMNVSRAHFGQYRVTAENSIGTYDQYLFLSGEGLTVVGTETSKDDKECTTSVVIAVTLGIICAVLAGYATGITILHRRKMTRKGTKFPDKTTAEITYVNSAYKSDVPKVPGTVRRRENIDDASGTNEVSLKQYTDLAQYSRDDITTYDVIQKI